MTSGLQKFSELPYERPNLDTIEAAYKDITKRFIAATTADEQNNVIRDWNALRSVHLVMKTRQQ
ncbi:MAG: hypothetical protein HYZ54_01180 [Ignavibacteriae bacterium]|nr:hypothetical protein [Ignavibacteriota bacterium]